MFAGPAHATHVACGQVITQNTTLDSDVGPCSNNGIIVGANNITLNLNGHQVFGTTVPDDGVGILISGRTGVRVHDGTVRDFDAGVGIVGGSANTVEDLTATRNIGSSLTDFGDGIAVSGSNNNTIRDNVVTENAPFDGIGLFNGSSFNSVTGNVITDNSGVRTGGPHDTTEEDDGIRLEPGSRSNLVEDNQVKRNGLDGIAVFFNATDNVIRDNVVEANGFHEQPNRAGDGIRVFLQANRTLVEDNQSLSNARDGIGIDSTANQILDNTALGNVRFDLFDRNIDCDANTWQDNTSVTTNRPCTQA